MALADMIVARAVQGSASLRSCPWISGCVTFTENNKAYAIFYRSQVPSIYIADLVN